MFFDKKCDQVKAQDLTRAPPLKVGEWRKWKNTTFNALCYVTSIVPSLHFVFNNIQAFVWLTDLQFNTKNTVSLILLLSLHSTNNLSNTVFRNLWNQCYCVIQNIVVGFEFELIGQNKNTLKGLTNFIL